MYSCHLKVRGLCSHRLRSSPDSWNDVFKNLTVSKKNTMLLVTLMKNGTKKNNISASFSVIQQPRPPNWGESNVSASDKSMARRIVKTKGSNHPINKYRRRPGPFCECWGARLLLSAHHVSPATHVIQTKDARKEKYFSTPKVKHSLSTSLARGLSSNNAMYKAMANTRLNCIRPGNDLYCCQKYCKMRRHIKPSNDI